MQIKLKKVYDQWDSNPRPQRGPELESGALTNSAIVAHLIEVAIVSRLHHDLPR